MSPATQVFQLLPPIIAVIMVALGMDVRLTDFRRLLHTPRAALVALLGQIAGLRHRLRLEQADGHARGALPPILDFERRNDRSAADNVRWIEAFVRVVEHELGRSPMIYTGRNVWRGQTGNTAPFVHLPLWQAHYVLPAVDAPASGLPWPTWTLWQWSGGGRFAYGPEVPGVAPDPGVVDLDRLNGNAHTEAGHTLELLRGSEDLRADLAFRCAAGVRG